MFNICLKIFNVLLIYGFNDNTKWKNVLLSYGCINCKSKMLFNRAPSLNLILPHNATFLHLTRIIQVGNLSRKIIISVILNKIFLHARCYSILKWEYSIKSFFIGFFVPRHTDVEWVNIIVISPQNVLQSMSYDIV